MHGASGDRLVSRLTEFANLCLRGCVNFQLVFSPYFAVHHCEYQLEGMVAFSLLLLVAC